MSNKIVKIRDLGLAAALVTYGYELLETRQDTGGRAHFIFAQSRDLANTVNHYWSDTLNLHARRFFDNTKMLKSRIYAEK